MWIADGWNDYEVIDCSEGEKLERWGDYLLVPPGPAGYLEHPQDTPRLEKDERTLPQKLQGRRRMGIFRPAGAVVDPLQRLTFNLKPFSFKHTGLFPEQAANWDWFGDRIRNAGRPIKVLNLFAYTGGATLAAAAAGASVTHVDASKGMVAWAKETPVPPGWKMHPSAGSSMTV